MALTVGSGGSEPRLSREALESPTRRVASAPRPTAPTVHRSPLPQARPYVGATATRTPAFRTQEQIAANPGRTTTSRDALEWLGAVAAAGASRYGQQVAESMRQPTVEEELATRAARENVWLPRPPNEDLTGPFGIGFDPHSTMPLTLQPGRNIAGGKTAAEERKQETTRAQNSVEARRKTMRDTYDRRARSASEEADREETTRQMTLEEWNALTPGQQAVGIFNANLNNAIQIDTERQSEYAPTEQQLEQYNAVLDDVFGSTYSSAPNGLEYAPEVMGVVQNLDMVPAQDLGTWDQFLRFDVAITDEQMKIIDEKLQKDGPEHLVGRNKLTPEQQRLQRAQGLVRAQQQVSGRAQAELAQGNQLLAGMTGIDASEAARAFGGLSEEKPRDPIAALNLDDARQDLMTRYIVHLSSQPEEDMPATVDAVVGDLAVEATSQEEADQMFNALVDWTRAASENEGLWEEYQQLRDPSLQIQRSPQQIADYLGSAQVKRG